MCILLSLLHTTPSIVYRTLVSYIDRLFSFTLSLLLLLPFLPLHQNLLLLKQLLQVAVLVHGNQDVAPAHKLLVDVQLWNGRPVRVLLDARPQLRILEHVEGGELFGADALDAEDLDDGAREAALGRLGRALHEEHDGRRGDGLVDGGSCRVGQETDLKGRQGGDGGAEC